MLTAKQTTKFAVIRTADMGLRVNSNPRKVHAAIQMNQGITFARLCEVTELPRGIVTTVVRSLFRSGYITSSDGGHIDVHDRRGSLNRLVYHDPTRQQEYTQQAIELGLNEAQAVQIAQWAAADGQQADLPFAFEE